MVTTSPVRLAERNALRTSSSKRHVIAIRSAPSMMRLVVRNASITKGMCRSSRRELEQHKDFATGFEAFSFDHLSDFARY